MRLYEKRLEISNWQLAISNWHLASSLGSGDLPSAGWLIARGGLSPICALQQLAIGNWHLATSQALALFCLVWLIANCQLLNAYRCPRHHLFWKHRK
jgi:hypothetical protein